jgi:RNA polymerase sigma-70 factor (ECF subfamily)
MSDFIGAALEHLDALHAYAWTLTRHAAEAEDLVQETYLRALVRADRLAPDSNLKAWLFTVLRNLWLNQLRRLRRGPQLSAWDDELAEQVAGGINDDPQVLSLREEQRRAVRRALDRLPGEFREVVVLRDLEDFSYREIADITGCPLGTVMSRLARGRQRLKSLLSEPAEAPGTVPQPRFL